MPRVKRGVTARARHKKVLALAKGFRGRRKNVFRVAKQAVMKAPKDLLRRPQPGGKEGGPVPLRRPPQQEARLPPPVDCPYQRRCA